MRLRYCFAQAGRASLAALLLASIFVFGACANRSSATPSAAAQNPPLQFVTSSNAAPTNSYADVVSRVAPAVVTIRSARRVRAPQQMPFMDDPTFRQFFGDRLPQQQQPEGREHGLGSGVIVTADGYILTNHHVVDGAEDITVELSDRKTVSAKVIGSDPPSDLAVLKIDVNNLPVVALGNSDQVRVGDVALAIGNPLGIGQTVTSGIISAKGRSTGLSDGSFEDFLQTDAPINKGNSGGALVNTNGDLIGINSQILSPSGGSIGIGFAIPVNMARSVMEQLLKGGKVHRGQLGVVVQPVTSDLAASLGMSEAKGVIINSVQPGSGADKAGLRQGDVIIALNGAPINDSNELRNKVAGTPPGTEVALTIMRDNREQQFKATLGEFVADAKNASDNNNGGDNSVPEESGKLGLSVNPLSPEIARQLNLGNNAEGLVIMSVDPNGPGAEAGLQQGDVIISANQQKTRATADLVNAIQRAGDRPILLLINRRGQTLFVPVRARR
ncbi:MAG TPA: DegQ family serine endoprotease [Pyrinomonadaceae bacterium]|jgi:Do/DeqQ family serine protease